MEILIAIIVAIVVIGGISAIMLMKTRREKSYDRPYEREVVDEVPIEPARPVETRRPRPVKSPSGGTGTTDLLIGALRAIIGLAALIVLIYIFNDTRQAAAGLGDKADNLQYIKVYAEGAFLALITTGIAVGLYIFSKFVR